ncbi:MAG: hypothetical protein Q9191_001401 [Dirinaria sp. TL-2023a]
MLPRIAASASAGLKQHPFSASAYLGSFFSIPARTFASSKGPAKRNKKKKGRAANIARHLVVKAQPAIRGITTPFVKSLTAPIHQDVPLPIESLVNRAKPGRPNQPNPSPAYAEIGDYLNHYLSKPELKEALEYSRDLDSPLIPSDSENADPTFDAQDAEERAFHDASATAAITRITSLANASSRDRTKANIRRIIEKFGRHNTDASLRPKAKSQANRGDAQEPLAEQTLRAGPDTGSSEVQIGILTAKIRNLADRYEGENRNDKINKRNLRLLLHRRQKLMKYMERKERGSKRWQNMIETLGLTAATYKGEISLR